MRRAGSLSSRAEQSNFKSVLGGTISQFKHKQTIYSQGETADTLFYIREGHVMLTVRPKRRRPAAVGVLDSGDFFGQSCLADVPDRLCTATAVGSSSILTIKKKDMVRILRGDSITSNCFLSYLLVANRKYQEQVIDLLVNPAGQRLARVLLRLAQSSAKGGRIDGITQTDLANMAGTTRTRTNFHMTQFRKRGFIRYHGTTKTVIQVQPSLRTRYLRD